MRKPHGVQASKELVVIEGVKRQTRIDASTRHLGKHAPQAEPDRRIFMSSSANPMAGMEIAYLSMPIPRTHTL
jgi:hypothetical protein